MAKAKSSAAKAKDAETKGRKGRTRTIINAKKSTGAPAPLRAIGGKSVSGSSSATAPSPSTLSAAETEEPNDDFMDGTLTPLSVEDEALETHPRRSSRLKDQAFCAGCHDGGKLARCEGELLFGEALHPICGRFMCYGPPGSRRCLELNEEAIQTGIRDKRIAFVCPACWKYKHRHSKDDIAYEGFFQRNEPAVSMKNMLHAVHSVRRSLTALDLVPVAVVAITLVGMAHEPYDAAVVELDSYYRASKTPFLKFTIAFDLSDNGFDKYMKEISSLVMMLAKHEIKRVIVFITTHSTPDTGLLHFMPNEQGAGTVSEVLRTLVPDSFVQYLNAPDVNGTLFMLACGGAFMHKASFGCFTNLIITRTFRSITAFPANDLQPLEAARWCQDYIRRVLIQKESVERALKRICSSNWSLGQHSNVLVWYLTPTHPRSSSEMHNQTLSIKWLVWYHSIQAPCGIWLTDTWCKTCHCLASLELLKPRLVKEGDAEYIIVDCRANAAPPILGPRGAAVSQFSLPCPPINKVKRTGIHLQVPFGKPNLIIGEWLMLDYVWPEGKGDNHVERFS
ncbi:hypothetical protein C8R42DRAFT_762393 [Lentinula raphanica]|nr:hypothetical protein C8R42DRAFT_762393 [Lentinula raphanica]